MKLLPILLFVSYLSWAGNPQLSGKFTEVKKREASFDVQKNASLHIENKYGSTVLTSWNQNRVHIEVEIKVSSDNESYVKQRIDQIDIQFSGALHQVNAKTIFQKYIGSSGKNTSVEIVYKIKAPVHILAHLTQEYGTIITQDMQENVNILSRYGKVSMGKLFGDNNKIKLEYSTKSSIDYIQAGQIVARYSGLQVGDFGVLHVDSDYTDLTFNNGKSIKLIAKYGKINVGSIETIQGNANYMTTKINTVSNAMDIDTKYSKLNVDMIQQSTKAIKINAGYSNIVLHHAINWAYDFDISLAYGNLKTEEDAMTYRSSIENATKKSYTGYHLKANVATIVINASYGNVTLKRN